MMHKKTQLRLQKLLTLTIGQKDKAPTQYESNIIISIFSRQGFAKSSKITLTFTVFFLSLLQKIQSSKKLQVSNKSAFFCIQFIIFNFKAKPSTNMYSHHPYLHLPPPCYPAMNFHYPFICNSYELPAFFQNIENRPTIFPDTIKVQTREDEGTMISMPNSKPDAEILENMNTIPKKVQIEHTSQQQSRKSNYVKYRKVVLAQSMNPNAGRNCYSNILRMFFRRLQAKVKSSQTIIAILKQNKMTLTFEDFESWYMKNRAEYRNYIKVSSVKRLFKSALFVEEQTKIMRILFKEFIETEALICNLTSKKAKREIILYNVKSLRLIFEEIIE